MHELTISVVSPPKAWDTFDSIALHVSGKKSILPAEGTVEGLSFKVPFDLKPDGTPFGEFIQHHGDKRRFIYLTWRGARGRETQMFRRIKLHFDKLPPLPWPDQRHVARIAGTDRKGGPACASADVLDS